MDSSKFGSQTQSSGPESSRVDNLTVADEAERHSSRSSDASSHSSQFSPNLSPSQNHPMTNSIISNLDLGEENRGANGSDSRIAGSSAAEGIAGYANGRIAPLAPQDVLGQPISLADTTSRLPLSASQGTIEGNTSLAPGADDSALDALMEAHQKQDTHDESALRSDTLSRPHTPAKGRDQSSTPNTRDASFGLDPDADTTHSVEGTPFRMAASSSRDRHHHYRHGSHDKSVYDMEEHHAPSHTTAATGAPETMKTGIEHTQTVPTASATGMPRFWPRRTSRSPSETGSRRSSTSSQAEAPKEMMPHYPPSGSLTLAIFASNITWQRRCYLLLASVAINVGLPFVNGVMLGFGEIFARTVVAPWIGLAPGAININAPGPKAASTGGAGLRYAGVGESKGVGDGRVSVESWEVEAGQRGRGRGSNRQ